MPDLRRGVNSFFAPPFLRETWYICSMRCHDCIKQNRPARKPVDHFCDACGFAITPDGATIGRTAAACVLVATAEAGATLLAEGSLDDTYRGGYGEPDRLTQQGAENMRRAVLRRASDLVR